MLTDRWTVMRGPKASVLNLFFLSHSTLPALHPILAPPFPFPANKPEGKRPGQQQPEQTIGISIGLDWRHHPPAPSIHHPLLFLPPN